MVPPDYNPDAEQVCPLKWLRLLQTVNRKEFKAIQGDAEHGWSLSWQWGRGGGGEMCPRSKTGHELGACTCPLRKCTAWACGREFYRESQLSLSANNMEAFFFQSLHQSKSALIAASDKTRCKAEIWQHFVYPTLWDCLPLYSIDLQSIQH